MQNRNKDRQKGDEKGNAHDLARALQPLSVFEVATHDKPVRGHGIDGALNLEALRLAAHHGIMACLAPRFQEN